MASDPPAHRAIASRVLILVVTWTGLTGVLVGAGDVATHWAVIERFDHHATSWVVAHRSHALDAIMKVATWGGSWIAVTAAGGLLLILVVRHRLPLAVVILAIAGWLGEVAAVNLVKALVDRQRPPKVLWLVSAHGGSFPSGHAANAVIVFATFGYVWSVLTSSRAARVVGVVMSVLGVLAIGFSRIELGVHWTTDVFASLIVVAAWLVSIGALFGCSLPLHRVSAPPSREATETFGYSGAPSTSSEGMGLHD